MAEAPIMPLYTDAWLADTAQLSAEEKGAYMGLLISMWRSPEPRLRLDHERLSRVACVSARRWAKIWPVLAEFFVEQDGHITQKRLTNERLRVSEKIESSRTNGKLGGRPKSLKKAENENPDVNSGLSQTEPNQNLSINHEPDKKEEPPVSPPAGDKKRRTRLPDNFPNEWCLSAAKDYWLGKGRGDLVAADIAAEFVAYCKANGKTYHDWPSAWQTWYVNAIKFNRPAPAKPASVVTDWDEVARRHEALEKGTIQ